MERKFLQSNWNDMRCQISEWWEELTDEDLDMIDGDQEQLIAVLQKRYGYTRNLAFVEVKIRMADYQLESQENGAHSNKNNIKALQYFDYDNDDWPEINNKQVFHGCGTKVRIRERDLVGQ